MSIEENPYFQKYKEEFIKRKSLEVKIEKLENKLLSFKEKNLEASFHKRENIRYEQGIKNIRNAYDELLYKTTYLEQTHLKLIKLFQKHLLLNDNFSNIKLNEQTKTNLINETRAILHEELKHFPVGKTFVVKNN